MDEARGQPGFDWRRVEDLSFVRWELQNDWPVTLLAAVLVAALVFAVWSYRWEGPSRLRPLLIGLRLLAFAIVLLVLLQPVLLLQYESRADSVVLAVVDRSQSMAVADQPLPGDGSTGGGSGGGSGGGAAVTRYDAAWWAVDDPSVGVGPTLAGRHRVQTFTVGDAVAAVEGDRPAADTDSTALGAALDEATRRMAGVNISAVVLVSDMAWNAGADPIAEARELGRFGVPVFPVPVGRPDPPDAAVQKLHVRNHAFPGEQVPLKVQVTASPDLAGRSSVLVARLDGRDVARTRVTLEAGTQMIELPIRGRDLSGPVPLEVELEPMPGEVTPDNNRGTDTINFLDEKVKVLYVEGFPRWEYRYLKWVLLRDPRLDVRFLMTEGDPDLAAYSPRYISGFPAEGQSSFDFDLVILGDVSARYFQPAQLEWMTEQVRVRGGSLLMVAGSLYSPQSYRGTPIAELLPVRITGSGWVTVPDDPVPAPTEDGLLDRIAAIGGTAAQTRGLWAQLAPLYDLPPVAAKPGATVLVTVGGPGEDGRPYPLIAWHRFGEGKTMFVGTELLWRLRKRTGRLYHERFWASAIQFLALSRLLGGNERITLETGRQRYAAGEAVRLYADVVDRYLEPSDAASYEVEVRRADGSGEPRRVTLSPAAGAEGFFQGDFLRPAPGAYEVTAVAGDREDANVVRFEVVDASLEMRDPSMRPRVAEQIAAASGGQVVALDRLAALPGLIEQRRPRFEREAVVRLWDHPAVYILLLLTVGAEWWTRRRQRLV